MAFMGSTIHDISNSTSSRKLGLTTPKNPDDENSSLNPFVIGLILESAIVLICWIAIKSSSTRFIRRQTTMDTKNKRAGNDVSRGSIPEEYCERSRERRKSNPSGVREIRRLSRMMAVVVFLYYISWLPILISNIVTLVTEKKSSKLVVLLTGMVSLIYALANPIIYGTMSMRYRWAYKRVFGAACSICGCTQRPRSLSASSNLSMSRSRALTVSQLFSDLASKETAAKEGNHGRQNTAYEQAEDAVYGKSNDVTVSSDDLSGGTRGMVSC